MVYHEKQRKQLCALHSLNNLFQNENAFSQQDLECISDRLSPLSGVFNPYKSMFGFGNYDINVIMSALQTKGYEAIWFDRRRDPHCLQLEHIFGFILNIENLPPPKGVGYYLNAVNPVRWFRAFKHWITIKKIDENYYDLDSNLQEPRLIGQHEELYNFLTEKNNDENCQILVVVEKNLENPNLIYGDEY